MDNFPSYENFDSSSFDELSDDIFGSVPQKPKRKPFKKPYSVNAAVPGRTDNQVKQAGRTVNQDIKKPEVNPKPEDPPPDKKKTDPVQETKEEKLWNNKERGEIKRVFPDPEEDKALAGYRRVLKNFTGILSDILMEPLEPDQAAGVMLSVLAVIKNKEKDRNASYLKQLSLFHPERRARALYKKTVNRVDDLVAALTEAQESDDDIEDLFS